MKRSGPKTLEQLERESEKEAVVLRLSEDEQAALYRGGVKNVFLVGVNLQWLRKDGPP